DALGGFSQAGDGGIVVLDLKVAATQAVGESRRLGVLANELFQNRDGFRPASAIHQLLRGLQAIEIGIGLRDQQREPRDQDHLCRSSMVTIRSAVTSLRTWRMPLGQRISISAIRRADPSPKCTRLSLDPRSEEHTS